MESHPLPLYPLALLDLMNEQDGAAENPPLGFAKRAGLETSVFNMPAHRILKALIDHSPSPEAMAKEFLKELSKCGIEIVHQFGEIVILLQPLRGLA
jgi:hypothetical protein